MECAYYFDFGRLSPTDPETNGTFADLPPMDGEPSPVSRVENG
jgi:hypothetical protein